MREDGVIEEQCEKRFCTCETLEPCTCINYPPYHCGVCGREFLPEKVAEARKRGWYREASKASG